MNKNRMFWIKVAFTLIVILASLFYLYPTYKLNTMTQEQLDEMQVQNPGKLNEWKDRQINLGLDLQGGLHLVMEVDATNLTEDEKKDAPERAVEVIRNRVDQFGVTEPSITLGEDRRILVQLPGVKDKDRAISLLKGTAQLTFQLLTPSEQIGDFFTEVDRILAEEGIEAPEDREGGVDQTGIEDLFEDQAPDETVPDPESTDEDTTALADADTTETDTTQAEADNALAESVDDTADTAADELLEERPFTSRLITVGPDVGVLQDDYDWVNMILQRDDVQDLVPPGNTLYWGKEEEIKSGAYTGRTYRPFYFVQDKIELTGEGVEDAMVQFNDMDPRNAGKPYVLMRFDRKAQNIFADVTGEHVNERLAIILDNIVQSAPNIQERINSASSRITGNFSLDEAKDLVIVLRAGALPAPLNIMEERSVGPSLGHDSITSGIEAILIGGLLVIIFMVVWYRGAGLIAIFALFLNIILLMAALAFLNATLTLPGIAGIILTIGMAVDANVLIFERIREEIRNRKTIRAAIDAGYSRAFLTILDANVTTLITAIVLFQFGTGPVKGFAVTLMYGIIISMFTAIVVSRLFFDFITSRWNVKQLSI